MIKDLEREVVSALGGRHSTFNGGHNQPIFNDGGNGGIGKETRPGRNM